MHNTSATLRRRPLQTYTTTTTRYNTVQPAHTRQQTAKATPVTTYNLVLRGTPGYDVTRTSYPGVPRSTSPARPRTPGYPGVRGMSNLVPRGTPKYDVLPDSDGWATSHVDALCSHHARVRPMSTRTPTHNTGTTCQFSIYSIPCLLAFHIVVHTWHTDHYIIDL